MFVFVRRCAVRIVQCAIMQKKDPCSKRDVTVVSWIVRHEKMGYAFRLERFPHEPVILLCVSTEMLPAPCLFRKMYVMLKRSRVVCLIDNRYAVFFSNSDVVPCFCLHAGKKVLFRKGKIYVERILRKEGMG